jgi:dienelactone hydrolase
MLSNFSRWISILLVGTFAFLMAGCNASTQVRIPVISQNSQQMTAELEAIVYKPKKEGVFPVVIFNHGSTGGHPKQTYKWSDQAKYFVSKDYVVIAPMRKGRGESSGVSLESEDKNCDISSWDKGIQSAMDDLDAVIKFAESIKEIKHDEIHLLGQSRGGFLSIAYAAEGKFKEKIKSVVNFSGGWVAQKEDQCPQDFNEVAFAQYGAKSTIPMLWLYGANDLYYGDESTISYHDVFKKNGGVADFHLVKGIPNNGHELIEHTEKWKSLMDDFLTQRH